MVKIWNFFELFGPPSRNALANLDGSTVYTRICAGLCPTYWITFGIAEKNRNGSCPIHEWDHRPIFWVFNSPSPAPQGPMGTTGGGGTSADIVPTPPKCKNSPLTPIATKISFAPFTARRGRQPRKAEKTHPNTGYARMQNLAWIGPRVAERLLTEQKTYSRINTSPIHSANGG